MTLDIIIKSRNILDRMHWAAKRKLKQEYALLIRNQMRTKKHYHDLITEPKFFTLEIVSYRKRLLDYDNLVGGCKQLIDALSKERFIWDDDMKHLGIPQFIQQKCSKGIDPFVTIYRKLVPCLKNI